MKRNFFVVCLGIVIFVGVCAASGAEPDVQNGSEIALDTVKTTFAEGGLSRIYTVRKGTDVREGVSISYHPNGKVAVEAPYKNGKLDGVLRTYFENGNLWQTVGYRGGIEEGFSITYFENGSKKSREAYKNGVLDGAVEEFYENDKLRRRLPYKNGQLHGVAKVFDEHGAVVEEMNFQFGLRHGTYRRYKKGIKVLEATFEQNRCVEGCDF
ncbi:MAG: toxin-antitoxin system YwqK family antitoxin [Fibrobacter sp.]|nr:toxin-antitoxin system YwqK family antitoxin [Fibrobacter sp.]